MKKLFYAIIALVFLMPFMVNAVVSDVTIDQDNVKEETNADGSVTKTANIYAIVTTDDEVVTEFVVKIRPDKDAGSKSENLVCGKASPYTVSQSKDGDYTVCKYTIPSGTNGVKPTNKKINVGTISFNVPSGADNCNLKYALDSNKGNPGTGATLDIALIAIGVAGVAGIYFATKSRKKLYSI